MAGALPFDEPSMQRIHALSHGVPRRINLLCDRALLGAYAHGQPQVRRREVDKAAREMGMDQAEIRRKNFGRELMGLIEKYTERAYKDGLVDGGVGDATLDDEDMDALNSVILEQRSYVRGFTDTLYEGEGVSDELAGQKPAMWWNKSVYPSYLKGLQSAAKNAYFEWVYGDAEHCNTCLTLNGQVHRMRDYAKRNLLPKSSALECKGYQCQCSLIPRLNAKASGVFPSATKSHEDEAIAS